MADVKTERNQAVYQAVMNGKTIKDIAEEFGINSSSVRSIYRKQLQKEERRKNPLYQLIEKNCEDEKLCTGIFTVLTRLDATTEEEFMKLNRKFLLRYARNCGEVMVGIIEKVQVEIKRLHDTDDAELIIDKNKDAC